MPSESCQFVKPNSERCKHSVAAGEKFCWQHCRGVRARWRSLTRNQTIVFCIAVASLAFGAAGLAATLWFGIRSHHPRVGVNQTKATGEAKTAGPCSPAVTGSNNRIIISDCRGAGREKVEQPAFHEKSDYVIFSLGEGGDEMGTTIEELRKKEFHPFLVNKYSPFTVRMKGDSLIFSFKLMLPDGRVQIKVENNEFEVNMPGCDWNYNANALEVVNEQGVPIFQMIRKNPSHIVINGFFISPGVSIIATKSGVLSSVYPPNKPPPSGVFQIPKGFDPHLEPIFKYPAWKFPGKYADGSN